MTAVSHPRRSLVRLALATAALVVAACANPSPKAAGNEVIHFAQDLDDESTLAFAHARLCTEVRSLVGIDEFVASRGGAVSSMLTTVGWSIEEADRPELESLDEQTIVAWRVVQVQRRGRTDEPMDFRYERWRIDLVREQGDWKLCGFARQ